MHGTKQRPGRPRRGDEPRAWGSIALAVGIAALGVQVGRLTWRTQVDPPREAALRWEPAPDLPLEPALGHRAGPAPPGVGHLARAEPSPSDGSARSESGTPAVSSPALTPRPLEPLIGPIAPPGLGYLGKPLPLPNQDQVRFLLRHDPLVRVQPADPLRMAPGFLTPPPASPGPLVARREPTASAVLAHRQETGRPPQTTAASPRPSELIARALSGSLLGINVGELKASRPVAPASSPPAAAPQAAAPSRGASEDAKPGAGAPPSSSTPVTSEKEAAGTSPAIPPGNLPSSPDTTTSSTAAINGAPSAGTAPTTGSTAPSPSGKTHGEETERPQSADEAPLRLRLTIDGGSGQRIAPGQLALIQVASSAPCHVAVYRIDVRGRITPLLSLSGSARMKPASAFSLAVKTTAVPGTAGSAVRERVVAIGSRRPLSSQEAQLCLHSFAPARDESSAEPAQPVQEIPLAAALRALADYAGRHPAGLSAAPARAIPAGATCVVASFIVGGQSRAARPQYHPDEAG